MGIQLFFLNILYIMEISNCLSAVKDQYENYSYPPKKKDNLPIMKYDLSYINHYIYKGKNNFKNFFHIS